MDHELSVMNILISLILTQSKNVSIASPFRDKKTDTEKLSNQHIRIISI